MIKNPTDKMVKVTTHKDGILASLYSLVRNKSIDAETLTVACFKAFPSLFSMDLFKEYPRMDRVTKRISDLINDGLITENSDATYSLTEKGLEWINRNSDLIRYAQEVISSEKHGITSQNMSTEEIEREIKKLQRTDAYRKYVDKNQDKITIADFMDFLKVDIYATKQLFDRKMKRITALCNKDKPLKLLLQFMSEKFGREYTNFKSEVDKLLR